MKKVRMRSPDDGKLYEFDASEAVEAQRRGWKQDLNTGQALAKGVGGMLPPLTGMAGGIAGLTAGGPPGAMVGAATGGALGEGGNQALRNMAGVLPEPDRNPVMQMLGQGAQRGAEEAIGVPMMGMAQRGMRAAANPLMDFALNAKEMGPRGQFIEELAMKFKTPITKQSIPFLKKLTNVYTSGVERAIARETANPDGMRFSWNQLRSALAGMVKNAENADVLSVSTERGLKQAQAVLKYKLEGNDALTPARVQQIKRWAQEEAKKLYEARAKVSDPKISEMERAYQGIAAEAQKMLEQIPNVAKWNRHASEAISLQEAIWEASKRKPPTLVPAALGAGSAALHGGSMMDPASLALGGMGFLGAQAALSPNVTSRLALWANNPAAQQAVGGVARQVPRALGVGTEALMGEPPVKTIADIVAEMTGIAPQRQEPQP